MSAAADAIGAWLARWVRGVLARPRTTVALTLLATVVAVWYAAGNLGVNTDTANMIDASLTWRRHFNEFREAFPARDRNLLIVVDAATPAAADDYSAALLAELRRQPDLYGSILLAGEGEFFARNGLLYLPTDEVATLVDRIAAAQPLLGLLEARFDGAAVLDVARRTLTEPAADAAELVPFYGRLAESIEAAAEGAPRPLAWSSLIAAGPEPTSRRVIVLQPAFEFSRMQPAATAIEGIRAAVARLDANAEAPVTVRLTGSVAMEHEELASVSRGAGFGALATFALVGLVLYAAMRSWRLLTISLVTLVAGLALTAAFAAVAIGHLNLLSIAFVVLNVGLGSDYVIHVLLRYKELIANGQGTDDALVETMRGVGSSLVLCAVTTAAGFYSFIPTTFSGVSELGLIAGTGVFFGLFVSVTLLPALLKMFGGASESSARASWINPRIFVPLNGRPRAVLGATVVAIVVTAAVLPWVEFDSNPIHLRDPESESVTTLLDLASRGEAPLLNLVAVAPDEATAEDWAARIRTLPEVRSVVTLANLVPQQQEEKLALLEDLELLLGPSFGNLEPAPAAPTAVAQALAALGSAARNVAAAKPLATAIEALEGRLAALPPAERDATFAALDSALTKGLPAELARLGAAMTAEPFGRAALPAALAERWQASDGRELIEISPRDDVSDNAAASRFIAAVHGVVPSATGAPVVYQEASATVVAAFERAFVYAFIMVTAIIWLVLRDLRDTLLVLVPILAAAVVTAGLTVLIDMPLNYANIIALPLLVGMGVDNGIHVVHRMRTDTAAQLFETSTMHAVLASGLTTVASFGNLAFSSHVGTASMGILLALGLAASMAATLIALPAWLKLYGGPGRRVV